MDELLQSGKIAGVASVEGQLFDRFRLTSQPGGFKPFDNRLIDGSRRGVVHGSLWDSMQSADDL
jgi:hypothetical protein